MAIDMNKMYMEIAAYNDAYHTWDDEDLWTERMALENDCRRGYPDPEAWEKVNDELKKRNLL